MRPNTCELRRGFSGEMDVERFVAVSCLRQCNLASLPVVGGFQTRRRPSQTVL